MVLYTRLMVVDLSETAWNALLKRLEKVEEEIATLKRRRIFPSEGEGGPSPRERHVLERVREALLDVLGDKDRLMTFMALERRPESPTGWASWSIVDCGDPRQDVDIKKISELLESCSNETRLKILYEVYKGPKYPKEITALTGLSGGALYHHLDILTEAGITERDNMNRIVRTSDGWLFCNLVFHLDKVGMASAEQETAVPTGKATT